MTIQDSPAQRQPPQVDSSLRNVTNPHISSELAGFAAARQFRGVFELHLTVPPLEENAQREFRDLCAQLALKPILIHALGAFMALQPMTSSYLQGEAPLVAEESAENFSVEKTYTNGLRDRAWGRYHLQHRSARCDRCPPGTTGLLA
jgi:hypothetical protein